MPCSPGPHWTTRWTPLCARCSRIALQSALQHLTDAAERTQDASTDQARTLNRAVRLLKEETGLRDLVQMYRSALYQG